MVRLEPMTQAEFVRYLETAIAEYAQAHLKAGDCEPDEALSLAQADYDSLLPEGLSTTRQHLYSIRGEGSGEAIGMVWFELRESRGKKSAYLYDFLIAAPHRGKGYGAETMRAVEALAKSLHVRRINLNVMGWNHAAKALYEKSGFHVAGIGMTKLIG